MHSLSLSEGRASCVGEVGDARDNVGHVVIASEEAIKLAHEGHQGMTGAKARLSTKVWWPGMEADVEKHARSCPGCQLVGKATAPEPISSKQLLPGKWEDLAVDLLGPLPIGDYILVEVDYYTRYYEVAITTSTTSSRIIKLMDDMFAVHGLPITISSDQGPKFVSKEFEDFLEDNNISHRNVTPLWTQANGEVERQNRSMLKCMKITESEGRDWRKELTKYLKAYRTTPHSVTGVPPAEFLFGRKMGTKLPELREKSINDEKVRDRDAYKKGQTKRYADERRNVRENDITQGEQVLLRQNKTNKLSTNFETTPYEVIEKKGNSVVIQSPENVRSRRKQ